MQCSKAQEQDCWRLLNTPILSILTISSKSWKSLIAMYTLRKQHKLNMMGRGGIRSTLLLFALPICHWKQPASTFCINILRPHSASVCCIRIQHAQSASAFCIRILHPACIRILHPHPASVACIGFCFPHLLLSRSVASNRITIADYIFITG